MLVRPKLINRNHKSVRMNLNFSEYYTTLGIGFAWKIYQQRGDTVYGGRFSIFMIAFIL